MSQRIEQPLAAWDPRLTPEQSQQLALELESGKALCFPHLDFALRPDEHRFLDPRWSDQRAKNISYDAARNSLKGAFGNAADLGDLKRMIGRFQAQAVGLINALFPAYRSALHVAPTSFRPLPVAGRVSSWRHDDARLHVDAFPSRPNQGERILRVFSNINPRGAAREWRVGEPFPVLAARFLPQLRSPLPGTARLLHTLGITKSRRSLYVHYMLQLHDCMKADSAYQRSGPQEAIPFPAGSSWICFSDQLAHAVSAGQFLLEQTLHLPVHAQYDPQRAPLPVLEALLNQRLV